MIRKFGAWTLGVLRNRRSVYYYFEEKQILSTVVSVVSFILFFDIVALCKVKFFN
ncbi:MAG: hypothetical protein PHD21_07305 [Flavobacteriales bacterium]|nr:hypothetical protein [Flavobacteriales bacterium]